MSAVTDLKRRLGSDVSTHIHRGMTHEEILIRDSSLAADYSSGMRSREAKKKYRLSWEAIQVILNKAGVPTRKGGKRIWVNKRVRWCETGGIIVCSRCDTGKPVDEFPITGLVCNSCKDERLSVWRDENREEVNRYVREWTRTKKKTDPKYRAICAMKCRLVRILGASGKKKCRVSVTEFLGISRNGFVAHIESLMLPGMTWENRRYGVWHIDHIIPCSAFDHAVLRQVRDCWHFTNLRPLWGPENLRKYNKITVDSIIGPKMCVVVTGEKSLA